MMNSGTDIYIAEILLILVINTKQWNQNRNLIL